MDAFFSIDTENLFISSLQQQSQLESLSNQALSRGIDLYSQKNYEKASVEFQRAINLNPNSDYAVDATKYLAQSYLRLNQTDKAVKAYQDTIKRNRDSDSLYIELGNLLYSENRFDEAVNAYQAAVNIDPNSTNQYSLGQGQLQMGNTNAAKEAFRSVIRLEPQNSYGYLGLGKAYAKDGDYKRAIEQYEIAITKQSDNYDVYLDMGYAYADMGEMDKAKDLVDYLDNKDNDLSTLLDDYINSVEKPKMLFAWGSSTFNYTQTFKTPVSVLDSYLENADATKSMNVKIQFSKDMDRSSIENVLNWDISRASGSGPAQSYNYGDAIPETEAVITPIPDSVLYDSYNNTATISFTIRQNSSVNATIDPSHIVFKFKGEDASGNSMDLDYDEFSGFSGVV
jgi:tetratricopeptide (TPR) repeat protein